MTEKDFYILKKLFRLSDHALIRLINRLFQTEYDEEEVIWKDWAEQEEMSVCLKVGGLNRYKIRVYDLEGSIRICAEDKGCTYYYGREHFCSEMQIREPGVFYFGKNREEEYCSTLEFSGKGQAKLSTHVITLDDCSAEMLEEQGLILFVPFLFYSFLKQGGEEQERQEALKYFLIHDIVGSLERSFQKGDLTALDVQKLKQLCRQMIWRLLGEEPWMQSLEMQELVLGATEVDLELLERNFQNKRMKN